MARGHRRARHSSDSERYSDWMDTAERDLECALLLKDSGRFNKLAAFHCQQCAEKALKAYILLMSGEAADGHNLTYLCRRAAKFDRHFSDWFEESARLNGLYIETRYPADIFFEISDTELEGIYQTALRLYNFIYGEMWAEE